ncbi:MAG: hypothetical protein Q8903_11025, partial [Bacteroidota bacterium]|nr:hypothetical protein [Bacteroidota bacterium]
IKENYIFINKIFENFITFNKNQIIIRNCTLDGNLLTQSIFLYDGNRILKSLFFEENNVLSDSTIYHYNSQERLVEKDYYNKLGYSGKIRFIYDEQNRVCRIYDQFGGKKNDYYEYFYNENSLVSKVLMHRHSFSTSWQYIYFYNQDLTIKKVEVKYLNGDPLFTYNFVYEYYD